MKFTLELSEKAVKGLLVCSEGAKLGNTLEDAIQSLIFLSITSATMNKKMPTSEELLELRDGIKIIKV